MIPPALEVLGFGAAIGQYIDGYAERSQLEVEFRSNPKVDKLPFQLQRPLFRIVQEALANVHRHAAASHVSVKLRLIANRMQLTMHGWVESCGQSSKINSPYSWTLRTQLVPEWSM
jgi:signal transduction histidine kinase